MNKLEQSTTNVIWEVQRFLSMIGLYFPDKIDGIYGNETEKAYLDFLELYPEHEKSEPLDAVKSIVRKYTPSPVRTAESLFNDVVRIGGLMKLSKEMIAYILATIQHETGGKLEPVEEAFYLPDAKRKSYQRSLRYYPYFGRGDIQLTWVANYEWVTKMFTPVDVYVDGRLGDDVPTNFVAHPEGLLHPQISLMVVFVGMTMGMFRRNHTLSRYFPKKGKVDPFNARLIVNGFKDGIPDKADVIQSYYNTWLNRITRGTI